MALKGYDDYFPKADARLTPDVVQAATREWARVSALLDEGKEVEAIDLAQRLVRAKDGAAVSLGLLTAKAALLRLNPILVRLGVTSGSPSPLMPKHIPQGPSMINTTTLEILRLVRAQVAAGKLDLPGEIHAATLAMRVSPGFAWTARDVLTRVCFPGEASESAERKVLLSAWLKGKSKEEVLSVVNQALDV